jgi:hypothetical protein
MAGIDITSLFADVLPDPQRQLEERTLQQSDAANQANAVGQLGGMAAYLAPQRGRAMAAAGKGLLGIDTRTKADHLRDELQSLGTPQTKTEHKAYADLLDKMRPGTGVQYMMGIAENELAAKDAETRRLVAINKKESLADADAVRHPVFSDIRANGLRITGSDDGVTRVTLADGSEVSGVAAATAINDSNAFDLQQAIDSTAGDLEQRRINDNMVSASNTVERLRIENAALDDVVDALNKGAYTGVFDDLLPVFTTAQAQLRQAQSQLGLSVVGDTTFGSLSAGELNLALNTALPTKMDEASLEVWVKERHALNKRIMDEMNEYALHIVNGGTEAQWVLRGDSKRKRIAEDAAKDTAATDAAEQERLLQEILGVDAEIPENKLTYRQIVESVSNE